MSTFDIPTVPGVDPMAIRGLTLLCYGEDSGSIYDRHPHIFYIEDDAYFCVTDGCMLVLLLLEHGLPDGVEWDEQVQGAVGGLFERFSSGHPVVRKDLSVEEDLRAWLSSGTNVCPKCSGRRSCAFLRSGASGSDNDDEALRVHTASVASVLLDRRRLQLALKILGVKDGGCDVSALPRNGDFSGLVLLEGENWKIMTAPVHLPAESLKSKPLELF